MNTLDQRILIPAPQSGVWAIISDLSHSAAWNADWQQVAFLTTKREGRATRFRCHDGKGKEVVVEITAWYNGLGYEYTYVDGFALKNPLGRIRLQEIPEGTIVQWTFQWEGSRGAARKLESRIEDNLKALYRQVTQAGRQSMTESKSVMRDGVPFTDRSQYQSRHPSAIQPQSGASEIVPSQEFTFDDLEAPAPATSFDFSFTAEPPVAADDARMVSTQAVGFDFPIEPPIKEDDTRPRPAINAVADQIPTLPPLPDDVADEPDFLDDLLIELDGPGDSASGLSFDFDEPAAPAASHAAPPGDSASVSTPAAPDVIEDISSLFLSANAPAPSPVTPEAAVEPTSAPPEPAAQAFEQPPQWSEPPAPAPLAPLDTSEVKSIWEIFGVPKPIESAEQARAAEDAPAAEQSSVDAAPDVTSPDAAIAAEPALTPDDTAPLETVETEVEPSREESVPKPPPGLMEALESLRSSTTSPLDRPLRRGGHRARMRVRRIRVRFPL